LAKAPTLEAGGASLGTRQAAPTSVATVSSQAAGPSLSAASASSGELSALVAQALERAQIDPRRLYSLLQASVGIQVSPSRASATMTQLMQRATEDLEQCRQFLIKSESYREQLLQRLDSNSESKRQLMQGHIEKLADAVLRRRAVSEAKVMAALNAIMATLNNFIETCEVIRQLDTVTEAAYQLPSNVLHSTQPDVVSFEKGFVHAQLEAVELLRVCQSDLPQGLESWLVGMIQCSKQLNLGEHFQQALTEAQAKLQQCTANQYESEVLFKTFIEVLGKLTLQAE
jgi:hypothetical protein